MSETNPEVTAGTAAVEGEKGYSLVKGIGIIILAAVIFGAVGVGVGRFAFWNNYDTRNTLQRDLANDLASTQSDPNNPDSHVKLGWDYYLKNDNDHAIGEFKQALSLDPKNYPAQFDLGVVYMKEKQWDNAKSAYQAAIAIVPNTFPEHLNLAITYINLKKYDDALSELSLAYNANPGAPDTMYWRGVAYEKKGDLQDAYTQYQAAIQFDPQYTDAIKAFDRVKQELHK